MNLWTIQALGDLVEIHDSERRPLSGIERSQRGGSFPYYGASGIIDEIDDFLFSGPHVLISEDGENLNSRKVPIAFRVDGKFWVNNHAHIVRGLPSLLDDRFLVHWFAAANISGYITGAAQPKLTQANLKRIEIGLPPLPTQRKIASILSAYDDLIENNTRRIKILEEMTQRVYKEWFVDYRYPGHEGVPLVESELGLIPQGWEMRTLSQLGNLVMGQSPPSSAYNEIGDGLPFHQGVRFYGVHYPVHQIFSVVGTRVAEEGDTLVSVRAPVGRINIADRQMILGRGLCAVRADKAPQSFLLHALKHFFREEDTIGNGAIFNAVNRKEMEMLPLAWAGDALAQAFNVLASPIWSQIRCLSASIDNQRATRDFLLPRLVSGEIDVSDLDIQVPEAA